MADALNIVRELIEEIMRDLGVSATVVLENNVLKVDEIKKHGPAPPYLAMFFIVVDHIVIMSDIFDTEGIRQLKEKHSIDAMSTMMEIYANEMVEGGQHGIKRADLRDPESISTIRAWAEKRLT